MVVFKLGACAARELPRLAGACYCHYEVPTGNLAGLRISMGSRGGLVLGASARASARGSARLGPGPGADHPRCHTQRGHRPAPGATCIPEPIRRRCQAPAGTGHSPCDPRRSESAAAVMDREARLIFSRCIMALPVASSATAMKPDGRRSINPIEGPARSATVVLSVRWRAGTMNLKIRATSG